MFKSILLRVYTTRTLHLSKKDFCSLLSTPLSLYPQLRPIGHVNTWTRALIPGTCTHHCFMFFVLPCAFLEIMYTSSTWHDHTIQTIQ